MAMPLVQYDEERLPPPLSELQHGLGGLRRRLEGGSRVAMEAPEIDTPIPADAVPQRRHERLRIECIGEV